MKSITFKLLRKKLRRLRINLLGYLMDIERWVAYRTYDKYHIVNTRLAPQYYDKDTIILHACFSILVDFIEIELASGNWTVESKDKISWKQYLLREINWKWPISFLIPSFRSRRHGLEYLEFISSEVNSNDEEKKVWEQIKTLYLWWKDIRPNRKDPNEESGLNEYWDAINSKYPEGVHYFEPTKSGLAVEMKSRLTEEEDIKLRKLSISADRLHEAYEKQDDLMLQKLIEVRRFMWF